MKLLLDMQKKALRQMSDNEATQWVIDNYPLEHDDYGIAFQLILSRSWTKTEQILLAKYYLRKLPYANARPYEIFLSKMAVKSFLKIVESYLPTDVNKLELLKYHLKPLLTQKKYENDQTIVKEFLDKLAASTVLCPHVR